LIILTKTDAKNTICIFISITILLPFAYFPISFGPVYAQTESGSAVSGSPCIAYDAEARLITISCKSSSISDVYSSLKDNSVLSKENVTKGNKNQWLLNAGIVVSQGSTLYINSTDTSWLKIASADTESANGINVYGGLKIDSVKITSWSPEQNDFVKFEHDILPSRELEKSDINMVPRPYLRIHDDATGTMDITNSELAYLGYESEEDNLGRGGLHYYGGNGSIIRGNHIHHDNWGFYSSGVRDVVIENNHVHHNYMYGFDPHTATHDMVIRNNTVHDHGAMGIICSLDCYNITIEDNEVYNSAGSGIMLSRNMHDSIVRNNYVHNEEQCIFASASHNNEIYSNNVENCGNGIYLRSESSNNNIYNNTIKDTENGFQLNTGASDNRIHSNTIINATELGISNGEDVGDGNTFTDNTLINATLKSQDEGEAEEEEEEEEET
jgi:poly(beta-D-mannuronate) C5 epimerase